MIVLLRSYVILCLQCICFRNVAAAMLAKLYVTRHEKIGPIFTQNLTTFLISNFHSFADEITNVIKLIVSFIQLRNLMQFTEL